MWYASKICIKVLNNFLLSPCRTPHLVPGKALENRRAWFAPPAWLGEGAGEDNNFLGPERRQTQYGFQKPHFDQFGPLMVVLSGMETPQSWREGERNAAVVRSVVKEAGSWETEQRDSRRKVPRPSAGICLNSWGNPPLRTHWGQGRECVCVNVCVLGVGVLHCNSVLGGRVGTERRGGCWMKLLFYPFITKSLTMHSSANRPSPHFV